MEPVRGQDDRTRERHARDGVWLPAGGENPGARGLPDSRYPAKTRDCKGAGHRPFTRPRQRQVGKSPQPTGRNGPTVTDHNRRASLNSAYPTRDGWLIATTQKPRRLSG